jgi:hypothetical protein
MRANFDFIGGTRLAEFVSASNPVDIIQGPLGSGKTMALCIRIMRHAQEQVVSPLDGKRHSRFAIVRNTMPDLRRSTILTWLRLFPEEQYGKFTYGAVMQHRIAFGDVETTVDFLSLDKDEDVRKLRSTEYTGIGFNEIGFIDVRELFDEARSRLRYPPPEHGGPNPWRGVIGDTNAPDEDHWLAMMTGQVDLPIGLSAEDAALFHWPAHWGYYMQPPALTEERNEHGIITGYRTNPAAENLQNLPPGYYEDLWPTAPSKAWIDSRLMNRIALVADGTPVWPMFRREFHVAREPLKPVPYSDVIVALDFGRVYPAALFAQEVNQRIYVQHEILGFNEPASVFAPRVKRFLEQHYRGHSFRCVGDPKGRDKGQQTEQSSYDIFKFNGMPVTPAPVKLNNIAERTEAVAFALNDNPSGVNRLVISPLCRTLIVGMAGRYHLVKEEDGELRPKKDKYSNLCDALQYLIIGLGDGRRMIGLEARDLIQPVKMYHGRKTMRRVMA